MIFYWSYWARRKLEKQIQSQWAISEKLRQETKSFPEFDSALRSEMEEQASLAVEDCREWWRTFLSPDCEWALRDDVFHPGDTDADRRMRVLRKALYVSGCRETWYRLCLAAHDRQRSLSVNPLLAVVAVLLFHDLGLSWDVALLTAAGTTLLYAIYKITFAVGDLLLSTSSESLAAHKMAEEQNWGRTVPIDSRLHVESLLSGQGLGFPPNPFASEVVEEEIRLAERLIALEPKQKAAGS